MNFLSFTYNLSITEILPYVWMVDWPFNSCASFKWRLLQSFLLCGLNYSIMNSGQVCVCCFLLNSDIRFTHFHLHSLGVFAAKFGWVRLPWQEWMPSALSEIYLNMSLCPECLPCMPPLFTFGLKWFLKFRWIHQWKHLWHVK